MNRLILSAVLLSTAGILTGCNTFSGVPKLNNAVITPADLKPGDTGLITMSVKDRHKIIARIEGVVTEEPRIAFKLHDDGEKGDVKAGDGIWSLQVDVPFQAPPGEFLLEFTAYRSDGEPVPIRGKKGRVAPLKTELPLIIRYPQ